IKDWQRPVSNLGKLIFQPADQSMLIAGYGSHAGRGRYESMLIPVKVTLGFFPWCIAVGLVAPQIQTPRPCAAGMLMAAQKLQDRRHRLRICGLNRFNAKDTGHFEKRCVVITALACASAKLWCFKLFNRDNGIDERGIVLTLPPVRRP